MAIENIGVKSKLKEYLDNKGIKQSWLAEKIGVSRGTLNNIINNKYNTSLITAMYIAYILEVKIEDIFEFYINDIQNTKQ